MTELSDIETYQARWTDLKKKKRQNLDKMKRIKRSYVKAKLEKKRINREVKQLQKEWQERIAKSPEEAKSAFTQELRDVRTEEIFPVDLEKEFDRIELKNIRNGRTMKTEDLSDDKDMRNISGRAIEALERELQEEIADAAPAPQTEEAEEPDDETKAQLDESHNIGLTDGDIIIDDNGNEEEVDSR